MEPKEIKTEDLTINIQYKKNCIVELNIQASPNLVKKALKRAIKEVSKELSIPGFRKGKAPEELILKQYAPNVSQKWQNSIADICFIETQKMIKIFPLNKNTPIHFNFKKHSLQEGAELTFSYETDPTCPTIDPKLFQLKKIKKQTVEEKHIQETIRQAQFFYATWEEVDRPIQENDYVILDLEAIDKEPVQKVFSDTRFEVKDQFIAKWMKDLLIGAKKGDVLEGISKPDDDLPEEEKKKFEPKKVRITIKKIEEASLPKLDDAFAQKTGAKNFQEMKDSVKTMLEKKAEEVVQNEKREQVNLFLLKTYPFDLPLSLIESEKKYRKDQMLQDSRFKKDWEKMSENDKKKFEEKIEKQSKDAISLFYLSRKIIYDASISITKEEIQQEALEELKKTSFQQPHTKNISKELEAFSLSRLYLKKAQDFILKNSEKPVN